MSEDLAIRRLRPRTQCGIRHERCPLCRAPRQFGPARFDLLACTECGLVVSADIWTPQIDLRLDDEWFGESWDPVASIWVRGFEALGNRRRVRHLRAAPHGGALLEVGFGSGLFLAFMQSRGWAVLGCDLSRSVCRRASSRWRVPTHCGDVASLPKGQRYDLVVMNHVLEHVQEPLDLLGEIRARMNPGARLYVAVPNMLCWEANLPGWIGYQPYHFTYFTPETLRAALLRSGFRIDSAITHEQFACWFQTVLGTVVPRLRGATRKNLRDRLSRRSGTSAVGHAYRAATAAFGLLSWPFRRVQERFGRGDEVIVLARTYS